MPADSRYLDDLRSMRAGREQLQALTSTVTGLTSLPATPPTYAPPMPIDTSIFTAGSHAPASSSHQLTKRTRKREFFEEMNWVAPWAARVELVAPYAPQGKRGRPPFSVETMLRGALHAAGVHAE